MQRQRGDAVSETEQKEMWALVELFGHQRIAGKVTPSEMGAGDLIRVDVPALKDRAPLTKYYNIKAIYAVTPVDEATATRMADSIKAAPVSEWVLEREVERLRGRQLHSGDEEEDEVSIG
jgi:hypothetical protein